MENKLINIDDIIIRKATKDDNFEEIAELIYETDPYIYPHWFHNDVDECKKVIIPLLDKEGFFFNYKSMHLAINKKNNKIIGLIQVIDKDTNFDYDYTELMNKDRNYKFTIENYIFELINEVKESGLPYFSNIVVHHDYRGLKLGSIMMDYILKEFKNKYYKFILDVLAENLAAVRLYEKMGFVITMKNMGFKNEEEKIEEYRMELDSYRIKK